ncbi:hypothetical protein J2T13_000213 [Paenibacillus sp. DS2015]|uniref:hypothetical protein n=1 Tax=Paenibacillus sp. DS2015 TaxID=3373917 RepID=UPI003D1EE699
MEIKRDLIADLAICDAATEGPWRREHGCECEVFSGTDMYPSVITVSGDDMSYVVISAENERFILESREGWPHAIRRAVAAEERCDSLIEHVVDVDEAFNDYKYRAETAEAEVAKLDALLQRMGNEIGYAKYYAERDAMLPTIARIDNALRELVADE